MKVGTAARPEVAIARAGHLTWTVPPPLVRRFPAFMVLYAVRINGQVVEMRSLALGMN